jgi:hypothetical protein
MNIGYTVFHSKTYNDPALVSRNQNVEKIHNSFSSLDYIESDVILVKDIKSYKDSVKNNLELRKIKFFNEIRFGAIGLIFTTFLSYSKMLDSDNDIFLIFEDDAQLNNDAFNITLKYLEQLPKSFDILSLYDDKAFYKKYTEKNEIGLQDICKAYNEFGTLVYAISKKGVELYYNLLKKGVGLPIDLYLFDSYKQTEKYAIKPTSKQPFFSPFFEENGDPSYKESSINKTSYFDFGKA